MSTKKEDRLRGERVCKCKKKKKKRWSRSLKKRKKKKRSVRSSVGVRRIKIKENKEGETRRLQSELGEWEQQVKKRTGKGAKPPRARNSTDAATRTPIILFLTPLLSPSLYPSIHPLLPLPPHPRSWACSVSDCWLHNRAWIITL